jgi:NTE family protein
LANQEKTINLIMEGGGVKGIGLVGALDVLGDAGYTFRRIAGTSAGAVTASLLAAGMPTQRLSELQRELSFTSFQDKGFLDHFGLVGKGLSLALEKGIYEGNYLRNWLGEQLASLNVRTFGDLKLTGPFADTLPPERRYKLVVLATDVSRGRLVRFPWDYHRYGLDPDKQLVADAVRASISIPFFFEPVKLAGSYLVDGGVISNFPVGIFEVTERHQHDATPTFGIKLSARPEDNMLHKLNDTGNTFSFAFSILSSILNSQDQIHVEDPCTVRRTIFVDTAEIGATEFDLSAREKQFLYESGQTAARKFLKNWDTDQFLKLCEH